MDAESSGMSSSSLQRGKACINCRRRKMRCDGNKPVCGPCVRSQRTEDCEYVDAQGRSRTQILEENITRLESRIHELENPSEGASNVTLHDPYALRQTSPFMTSAGERPESSASGSFAARPHGPVYANISLAGSAGSSSEGYQTRDNWWNLDEPPLHIAQTLLDSFFPNASQFGFFLDIPRFCTSFALQFPLGHPYRPSSALLSTLYLWGLHLSRSDTLRVHEKTFLSRSLQQTSNVLSGSHPQKVLHALQAEILLAYYFFRNGRFVEGKYHCSAAASITISSGFNKIRSSRRSSNFVGNTPSTLPPPRDAVDEGERINGFWAAVVLDKCWSVALGSPSNFTDDEALGTRIDTPWPLESSGYEQGLLQPDIHSYATVKSFLGDTLDLEEGGFSGPAIRAQASLLFQRANCVAGKWKPDIQPHQAAAFRAEFLALDQLMDKFQNYLTPFEQFQGHISNGTRDLLITHSLAYGATIQLHKNFASCNANSNKKCMAAASVMVMILHRANISEPVSMDPITGTLWMVLCQVIIADILRQRNRRSNQNFDLPIRDEAQLIASVQTVMATMTMFAADSPIINFQLAKVREAYGAI